jgi:hypothetical protein
MVLVGLNPGGGATSISIVGTTIQTWEISMKAEIVLKYDEKERLLASLSRKSPARSVLHRAEPKSNQPQLVTITCDAQAAADILGAAYRYHGSTWRVMHKQMKRLGLLKSVYKER